MFEDVLENAPEYTPTPSPGITLCDLSSTICRASSYDTFLLCVVIWSTAQLTWTSVLVISHLWQASRQMTTFEVSNLGRYGYMGGRGGQSLRDQSGALLQLKAQGPGQGLTQPAGIGAGVGPTGAEEEGVTANGTGIAGIGNDDTLALSDALASGAGDLSGLPPPPKGIEGLSHPPSIGHTHRHGHSHGPFGIFKFCGALCRGISGPLLQISGLDRFTRGKAMSGMKRAGRDQNPFDMGFVKVSVWLTGSWLLFSSQLRSTLCVSAQVEG